MNFEKKYLETIFPNGVITKKSYSNIALIKYWGKYTDRIQIPLNSSISYSLSKVYTKTRLIYSIKKKKIFR
ncbi:hypothetical protein [Blattabacterium cuenoti]|uniref:hypothetical protein n=1 Tax=Blattabacterium cuenoti TaxID=1653831 RepID=UPI003744384B